MTGKSEPLIKNEVVCVKSAASFRKRIVAYIIYRLTYCFITYCICHIREQTPPILAVNQKTAGHCVMPDPFLSPPTPPLLVLSPNQPAIPPSLL